MILYISLCKVPDFTELCSTKTKSTLELDLAAEKENSRTQDHTNKHQFHIKVLIT